jgi:chorismate dehydratase
MLEKHDAALIIGDPALKIDRSRYPTYDLAEEWARLTGKPFVFAFWAVRRDALAKNTPALDLPLIFQESRDHGLESGNILKIAQEWGRRLELKAEEICSYLTQNIYYNLDAGCIEGLHLFLKYAEDCGALPRVEALDFMQPLALRP